jgi:anti-sigma regulatory factor (Ser/Thr protein kinase)
MDDPNDRIELDSRLTELSRIERWAEAVADRHEVAESTRFSIHLCLEEALANVVMHGYRNEPGHPIVVRTFVSDGTLFFAIDDQARPFELPGCDAFDNVPKPANLESIEPGGNGLLLLHRFAGSVGYERLPHGNRVTIGFPVSETRDVSV